VAGHRAVDAARDVRHMALVRVATHATTDEARTWIERRAAGDASHAPREQDLRAEQRASLEALGIRVVE
jgi:hypothetical protein